MNPAVEIAMQEMGLDPRALEVNKHDLDTEFQRHPSNIAAAASAVAQARRVRDEFKLDLVRVTAQVRRETVASSTGKRLLAKDLELTIDSDPEVRRAERDLADADNRIARYDAVLQGLVAKTSALKHLSELYQTSYYVTGSAPVREDQRTQVRRR